jgi:hypothetical protein
MSPGNLARSTGASRKQPMSSTTRKVRAIAVLKLSTRIRNIISFAQSVATSMTAESTTFPPPTPTMTAFQADIGALVTAETAALARAKGAVDARTAKLQTVRTDLENLKAYVQAVADAANPSNASSIIESSGMTVRKNTLHDKPTLAIRQGSVSGTVVIVAKAVGRRAAYGWEYSTDQKTWTSLPQTIQAKTGASGLTSATLYYFRVQPLLPSGEENWSDAASFLVK